MERSSFWVEAARVEVLCSPGDYVGDDRYLRRAMTEIAKNGMPLHMRELGDLRVPATTKAWSTLERKHRPDFRDVLPFNSDYLLAFDLKLPEDASEEIHSCDLLADEIVKTTQDVALAWNLAEPGIVNLRAIHIVTDAMTMLNREQHATRALLWARAAASKEGWPSIDSLPFDLVWTWLKSQEWLTAGISNSATSRAICAFSHLLRATEPAVQLFWSLVGLEAFYTEGDAGLLAQMRAKAPLVLGSGGRAHKLIGDMYQVRSKFVHGKLNFMSAHHVFDPKDESEHSADLTAAVNTAIGMLVASLQQLIRRNWLDFRFEVALLAP